MSTFLSRLRLGLPGMRLPMAIAGLMLLTLAGSAQGAASMTAVAGHPTACAGVAFALEGQSAATRFNATAASVHFNANSAGAIIALTPIAGSAFETDETVQTEFVGGAGSNIDDTPGAASGTILDDTSLHTTLDGSGNLTIADVSANGRDNALTFHLVNGGGALQITDPGEVFDGVPTTSPASTVSNSGHTLTIPFSAVTGSLTINTAGGNDTVTLDLSGGNFIRAAGVFYNGGEPAVAPGDTLIISGGAQGTVTYNHLNAHDGNVVMSNFGTVNFTGLEPVINSGTATDVIFNLPGTNNVVTLGDNGTTPGDGLLRLSSSPVTFEQTDFAIPSNSLTINLGDGTDTLTVAQTPQFTASLIIHGGTGDDTINLNGTIAFDAGQNLNIDLQNDGATPGTDTITIGGSANYVLSGTGHAILTASKSILINTGGHLATQDGVLTVAANQQATSTTGFSFTGVTVSGTFESTGTGTVTVFGKGGDNSAGNQVGVRVTSGGLIRGGATGDSTFVTGYGGISLGTANSGVQVAGGTIQSLGGNILITGVGGGTGGASSGNGGIGILSGGQVLGGTNGAVLLDGARGVGTGNAIALAATGATVTSSGTGNITIVGDTLRIDTSSTTINAGANLVTLRQKTAGTAIDIGSPSGPSTGLVELSNAELNQITAGTVQVGDSHSGAINITTVISPLNYNTLSIGNAMAFTSSGGFASAVTSGTVYKKMVVAGAVTIDSSATLTVNSATYVPTASDSFTVINNTSAGTTTGAFKGKPEGSIVVVGGFNAMITYAGGPGNNDVILQGMTVAVTIGTTAVLESSVTGLVYTFTRTGDLTQALPINFTTSGTATFPDDYTASSSAATFDFKAGTLTIPAGAGSVTVTLVPVDDNLVEGDETAILTVVAGSGYGVSGSPATGTIMDNDTATVGFTLASSAALESVGSENINITLTINAIGTGPIGLASDITANLFTMGGTATGGGIDYQLPGAVTFAAGTYATGTSTQSAALAIVDDRLVEGDETAVLGLTIGQNIGTQASIGGTISHTLTIIDNDTATVGFTAGTSTALESIGTKNISTTLSINAIGAGPIGLASDLTANLTTTGGTATDGGTDYTLPASPAVTFAAGTYATGTATQNAAVAIVDDLRVEGDETAVLGINIAQNIGSQVSIGGNTGHTLTIIDNDTATIGFVAAGSTVGEADGNDPINVVLSLNVSGAGGPAVLDRDVTFNLTTTGGTATGGGVDYTLPGALTFPSGSPDGALMVAKLAIVDDALIEPAETANLGLSISTDGTGGEVTIGGGAGGSHVTTIVDNDTATVSIAAITDGRESPTPMSGKFTVTMTGPSSTDTVVSYSIGGTATNGSDYTTLSGMLTIMAGQTSGDIIVDVKADATPEGNDTVILTLTGTSNAAITVGAPATATVNITDNSAPTITGTVANQAVNDNMTIKPFASVVIGDVDTPAQVLAVTIMFSDTSKGALTTLNGFVDAGGGLYTFSGTAAAATAAIQGVVFTPINNKLPVGMTETAQFTVTASDHQAPVTSDSTTTVVITSVNDAPVLVSGSPSATPNPAVVRQPIQFSATATDADKDPLKYLWDFMDGTTSTQVAPTHIFSAAGAYLVKLTVSDNHGGSATGTVNVMVAPATPGDVDTDGDGFSDEIELALNSDPFNANSHPDGLSSPTAFGVLSAARLRVHLDFARANADTLTLTGHLPVNGVIPVRQVLIVDVGGVVKAFVLDGNGRGKLGKRDRVSLHIGRALVQTSLKRINFNLHLEGGSFSAALADEQLTAAAAQNSQRSVKVTVIFLNTVFKATVPQLYTVRGSTGTTKMPE